jgi:hypothetical protein
MSFSVWTLNTDAEFEDLDAVIRHVYSLISVHVSKKHAVSTFYIEGGSSRKIVIEVSGKRATLKMEALRSSEKQLTVLSDYAVSQLWRQQSSSIAKFFCSNLMIHIDLCTSYMQDQSVAHFMQKDEIMTQQVFVKWCR